MPIKHSSTEYLVKDHADYHAKYEAIDAAIDKAFDLAVTTDSSFKDPRRSAHVMRTLAALDQYHRDHPEVEAFDPLAA